MAKYTGPRGKLARRFGVNLFGNPKYDRVLAHHPHGPGQHGPNALRRKVSDYGAQLIEKQKLRHTYGIMEKQFRRLFRKARQMRGVTGENLLQLLETRLDTVVFRAGFGRSLMQARQMVNHGHLLLNGRKVDIPSHRVKPNDVITVRDRPASRALAERYLAENPKFADDQWLKVDTAALAVAVARLPQRGEIRVVADEQLVVELYSK